MFWLSTYKIYRQYTFILHFSIYCFIFMLSLRVCSLMWLRISYPLFYISYLYACFLNTCSVQRSFLYYIFYTSVSCFSFIYEGFMYASFMSVLHGGFAFGYSLICEVLISFSHTFFIYISLSWHICALICILHIYLISWRLVFFFFMPGVQGTATTGQK